MPTVRQPAVAGTFYPGDASTLQSEVSGFLSAADTAGSPAARPKAVIAPHAGFPYSGPIAGTAFQQLAASDNPIDRVIHLGPAHFVPVDGIAASSADAFRTPLGDVSLDRAAIDSVLGLPRVSLFDEAHRPDHALEVQLPFLQEILGPDFRLVPFLVGDATPAEVEEVLDRLWGGPETLIVVSSDLSHFLEYDAARKIDRRTADSIEALDAEAIDPQQACGRIPIQGLLRASRRRGLEASILDLRNSGDTAGTRDRVVGYAAGALH